MNACKKSRHSPPATQSVAPTVIFLQPERTTPAPEFDSSKAHFRPTPSNGAGFRATGRQKPRYTGC